MTVDNTELLKSLKKPQPHPSEPTDAEKNEAANELHDWLAGKVTFMVRPNLSSARAID